MAKKRVICIGYSLDFPNHENIGTTNMKLPFGEDVSWKKNIANLKKRITRNEIRLIVLVVSEQLIDSIEHLESYNTFLHLLEEIGNAKTIVLIKENFLQSESFYYDFKEKKRINLIEIQDKIRQLTEEIAKEKILNKEKLQQFEKTSIQYSLSDEYFDRIHEIKNQIDIIKQRENYLLGWLNTYKEQQEVIKKQNGQKELIQKVLNDIDKYHTEKYQYDFANNIVNIIKDRLNELLRSEIFNFYISHDNFYADEFGDFVQLFEKYLRTVENINISLEVNKTSNGTLYLIKDKDGNTSSESLSDTLKRFSDFVELCNYSPENALKLIENKFENPNKALEIIQKISTKYKRLLLDIQQQKEKVQLSIKQEIQSEFLELNIQNTPISLLESSLEINSSKNTKEKNKKHFDKKTQGFYDKEELQLLEIVQSYANHQELINIKSSIDLIKDPEITVVEKQNSLYKIKQFLLKLSKKGIEHAETIAVKVITTYLENKVK